MDVPRVVRDTVLAVVFAGLTLVGPAATVVLGHAQLVTSTPASGEVVPTLPTQLRLVFSEPIDPTYTRIDVLDANGRTLVSGVGAVDPTDPTILIAPVTLPADGLYTVDWRSLSAADGHITSGFYTFGVGDVAVPTSGSADVGGSIHAGHDAATTLLETEARAASDLGSMLAFGIPLIAWVVLRDPRDPSLIRAAALCLLVAGSGALVLLLIAATTPGIDPVSFVLDGRTGRLLLARVGLALVGAALVWRLGRARPRGVAIVVAAASAVTLGLIALGGHAAAYADPVPVLVMVVHLAAAAVWAAGVVVLTWTASLGRRDDRPIGHLVPRFSALAVVAVGLILATGAYSDWLQTRSLLSLDTPYEATLAIKIALVAVAFAIGGLNLIDGGRDRRIGSHFRGRILVESAVLGAVIIATAVLSSGSPPALDRPVEIAVAPTSALDTGAPARLGLAPGRPGPTQFVVILTVGPVPGGSVELDLDRLDANATTRIKMRDDGADARGQRWVADGGLLPADSRWDATVVIRDPTGAEMQRTRFVFALDTDGVTSGRATPPLDPVLLIGFLLLSLAVIGSVLALSGVAVPRLDRRTARASFAVGSVVAGVLGVAMLLGGSLG